jgi:hypothetical protein
MRAAAAFAWCQWAAVVSVVSGLTVAKTTVCVAMWGSVQLLSRLGPVKGKVRRSYLPASEAGFSLPANSSRLEIEGSNGFCSSAGGDGGDWGRCRWYWYSTCCGCAV